MLTQAIEAPEGWSAFRVRGLAQDEHTLAGQLRDAGYSTAAFVAGPWMKRVFGLDRGFDHYDDAGIESVNGRRGEEVTDAALDWLRGRPDAPFFLFVNYYDPHGPYSAPEPHTKRFLPDDWRPGEQDFDRREELAFYDGEIYYMDLQIGRLLEGLRQLGLYDQALIAVFADHGELIGEHGQTGHGKFLFEEEVRVAMFVRHPAGEVVARRTDMAVQPIDLFPLILKRVGLAVPDGIQGELPPYITRPIVSETYPLAALTHDGHWRALYEGDYKFVWSSQGRHQLFRLSSDPGERINLAERDPQRAAAMAARLAGYLGSLPGPGAPGQTAVIDEDTRKALESLGYVD